MSNNRVYVELKFTKGIYLSYLFFISFPIDFNHFVILKFWLTVASHSSPNVTQYNIPTVNIAQACTKFTTSNNFCFLVPLNTNTRWQIIYKSVHPFKNRRVFMKLKSLITFDCSSSFHFKSKLHTIIQRTILIDTVHIWTKCLERTMNHISRFIQL